MPGNGSRLIAILMVRLEFKRLLSVAVYTPYLSTLGASKFSLRPIYLREDTSLRRDARETPEARFQMERTI